MVSLAGIELTHDSGGEASKKGHLHELYGSASPALTDQAGVGEIAHIAEHARIFDGALLAGLVGVVAAMGADKGKDPLENRGGQL